MIISLTLILNDILAFKLAIVSEITFFSVELLEISNSAYIVGDDSTKNLVQSQYQNKIHLHDN